jgi:glycine cleavage system H protein
MKYTKDHEWIRVENGVATLGITSHAAEALGELVYVELPAIGSSYKKGDAVVVVESSKSASDVYTPVSGEVIEVNKDLVANPENVNNDTYDNGWLIKIKVSDQSELDGAMSENNYKKYLSEND